MKRRSLRDAGSTIRLSRTMRGRRPGYYTAGQTESIISTIIRAWGIAIKSPGPLTPCWVTENR